MIPPKAHLVSFRRDIEALLKSLKAEISSEYRAHPEDTIPGIAVTIGAEYTPDGIAWNYQTGDNSFAGAAYSFAHWGICDLHRRDNCRRLADDIVEQFLCLWS